MNSWLKIDAKFNDKERALSINLEQVQYLSIYDGMVLFHLSKEEILAVGPEDSPANSKVDKETMELIMQGLRRYKALGY